MRGAWDARLEALVVDAVLRAETDEAVLSRASALGWKTRGTVCVVLGTVPARRTETDLFDEVRRVGRRRGLDALCAVQGDRLVVLLGGVADPRTAASVIADLFGDGPVVVGPVAADLGGAAVVRAGRGLGATAPPRAGRTRRDRCSSDDLLAERALGGDGHARRQLVDEVYLPLVARPRHPGRDAHRLARPRRLDRGRRPGAVRAPQHGPLPAPPGRRADRADPGPARATPSRSRSPWSWGASPAGVPPSRHSGRERSTDFVGTLQSSLRASFVGAGGESGPPDRQSGARARHRRARPGRPDSRLPDPLARGPGVPRAVRVAVHRRLDRPASHYGTEARRRRDPRTEIAQPLLVATGLVAALGLFPHPTDAFGKVSAVAGHSVGELTAAAGARVITAEQAMVLVRERGKAMAAAAATTPTGMTAVLGGDRDEVLAVLEKHGLTAANDNGPGQVVAAGTLEQLQALADDPPEKARLMPLSVAGAFHTEHMAARRRPPRRAGPLGVGARPAHPVRLQPRRPGGPRRPRRAPPDRRPDRQPGPLGPVHGHLRRPRRHRHPRDAAGRHPDRHRQARAQGRRDLRPQDPRPARRRPRVLRQARRVRRDRHLPDLADGGLPGQGHLPHRGRRGRGRPARRRRADRRGGQPPRPDRGQRRPRRPGRRVARRGRRPGLPRSAPAPPPPRRECRHDRARPTPPGAAHAAHPRHRRLPARPG